MSLIHVNKGVYLHYVLSLCVHLLGSSFLLIKGPLLWKTIPFPHHWRELQPPVYNQLSLPSVSRTGQALSKGLGRPDYKPTSLDVLMIYLDFHIND